MNTARAVNVARLVWAAICLLFALLIIMPAQSYSLWQLSILATEFSVWLAIASALALLPGWRAGKAGRVAAACAALALLLALMPMVRALRLGFNPLHAFKLGPGQRVAASTIEYAPGLQLDLYKTRDAAPVVLVIHGGSWRAGDRLQLSALNHVLARAGYAVASIDYRLAPAHPYPAALHDVNAALTFLQRHAQGLRADATRTVLLGRSAGGHLALLAAYTRGDPAIKGVISFYGPTDLRWSWHNPGNPRVIDTHEILTQFMGGTLEQKSAAYDRGSPLRYVRAALPTLLLHGRRDELVNVRQSRRLHAALGPQSEFLEMPWATHGCDFAVNGPCGQVTTRATLSFLARTLR